MGVGRRIGARVHEAGLARIEASRVHVRLLIGSVGLCAAILATSPTPASAAIGHKFLASITEAPPGTPISEPRGVAVDRATGDIFVADVGTNKVDVFDASRKYLTQFATAHNQVPATVAVDEASGYVYVGETEPSASEGDHVDVFKPGGGKYELVSEWDGSKSAAGRFGEVTGLAVDSSKGVSAGDVYVLDATNDVVDVYVPPGASGAEPALRPTQLTGKFFFEEPTGLAVNATNGKVYVLAGTSPGFVDVFSAAGAFELKVTGKGSPNGVFQEPYGIAVDSEKGDIYVSSTRENAAGAEVGTVEQFTAEGVFVGAVIAGAGGASLEAPRALAVGTGGKLYVGETEGRVVDEFGPEVVLPDVVTGKATIGKGELARSTATLHGTINPLGKPATYRFEYGENEEFQHSIPVPDGSAGSGSTPVEVEVTLTGLKPGTQYVYRLVGENENGTTFGQEGVNKGSLGFTTGDAVEGVVTGAAANVTTESAELAGFLEPNGHDAHYYFEYGTTELYGSTSPAPPGTDAGAAVGSVAASTVLTGLKPNTTYHYRIIATNEFGTTAGSDATFTTTGLPIISPQRTQPITHTEATLHSLLNPGGLATTYHYEYGETTAYGTSAGAGELAAGSTPQPVTAALTGLHLATTYHFRLVASNSVGTTFGPDEEFTTVLFENVSVRAVTSSSAELTAQINPLGLDTTYHFEYGESTAYGATTPVPDGDAGTGSANVEVTAALTGLKPGTTYHYRLGATVSTLGSASSADHTFTTAAGEAPPAPVLPDGRAWEMVSPVEKHGAPIQPLPHFWGLIQAAEDGSALTYAPTAPITADPEGNRAPEPQQALAIRGAGTWSTEDIATAHSSASGLGVTTGPEYRLFSPELSLSLMIPFTGGLTPLAEPPLSPPVVPGEEQEKSIFLRADAPIAPGPAEAGNYEAARANGSVEHGPGYLPLVSHGNTPAGTHFGGRLEHGESTHGVPFTYIEGGLKFVAATPDLSHVVIRSELGIPLNSEQTLPYPEARGNMYEWAAGQLKLVNVLPNGTPGGRGHTDLGFGQGAGFPDRELRNAISADGSHIVWSEGPNNFTEVHLYDRDMVAEKTVQIDAAQGGTGAGNGGAVYQIASSDGSKVFFSDSEALTADANHVSGSSDLYVYENGPGKLTDLTPHPREGEGAGVVKGVVPGASSDGSHVYVVATGVLAPGATSGADNLYLLHDTGSAWTTTFIAALSPLDRNDWAGTLTEIPLVNHMTARVSPSGRYLTFMSSKPLTGYNNTDAVSGVADQEVFLYDAQANKLSCVSCNPSGARPVGVAVKSQAPPLVDQPELWNSQTLAGSIPGYTNETNDLTQYQSRYLSDSGRMFFMSPDNLVPAATNGKEDVYEYEPLGVGDCTSASGCVSLLSSGTAPQESAFLDASTNGDSVFFLTASQLLPTEDIDGSYDIYNARVCTSGSPCITPPPVVSARTCESAEGCGRGAVAPPSYTAPASTAIAGSGNVTTVKIEGTTGGATTPKPPLTRAQKLKRALASCRRLARRTHAQKHRRAVCETNARRHYGPKMHKAKTKRRSMR